MSFFDRFRQAPSPKISPRDVDPDALTVIHRLHHAGFTAYLVGGGVRDILLGRTPKDFDVATDARPGQIKRLFRNAFVIGRRFRLVLVRFGDKQIETATFRRDPEPDSPPAPESSQADGALYQMDDNEFGTPEEDALRRDFTVNALFYDPDEDRVIDYVGGLRDLRKRTLRCIGDPNVRFREDPVRMLRAVRLSSRLGFTVHSDSVKAIRRHAHELSAASRPRLFEELLRLFTFCKSEEAFRRLYDGGLMDALVPAVAIDVRRHGGSRAPLWRYLAALDARFPSLETQDTRDPRFVQENVLRLAALLAPLWRAEPRSGGAERLVSEIVVEPFRSRGWRPPKFMCMDLCSVLESLRDYPSRDLRRRGAFSRPWFHTALVFWEICAEAEDDRTHESALAQWRAQFDAWSAAPHPDRRGRYVPVDPDSAGGRGFAVDPPAQGASDSQPAPDEPGESAVHDAADEPGSPETPEKESPQFRRRHRRRGGRRERLRRERLRARTQNTIQQPSENNAQQ